MPVILLTAEESYAIAAIRSSIAIARQHPNFSLTAISQGRSSGWE
jgi:hypothetical protein